MENSVNYSADFETTTDVNDCRVWAWCCCEIGNENNIFYGNCISSFIEHVQEYQGVYYFHNLAFDGEFILNYLLKNGFECTAKRKQHSIKTLISDTGKFYSLTVYFDVNKKTHKYVKVVFKDSLKKLPFKVEKIAKDFNLSIRKLTLNYSDVREVGHKLTQHEKDYITNDVVIVSQAINQQLQHGFKKLTVGSDALYTYKEMLGKPFNHNFPTLSVAMDTEIRKAYRGGWTYVHECYAGKIVGCGSVYDVNSLYPSVMRYNDLPYGKPHYYRGKYIECDEYPLYIQFITCTFKLKHGYLPMIQIKNSPFYMGTEYLKQSEGLVQLALTSVDLRLFVQHYDVNVYSYDYGYMFHSRNGMFNEYIDHFMEMKVKNKGAKRLLAKLMLNSLYGKFATNPNATPKIPYIKDDGSCGYQLGDVEIKKPVYTPLACFVTAWARYKTITSAQAVYDRFLYADTDSIHVLGQEKVNIDVDPDKLGWWKHESNFSRAKFIRAKTYIEDIESVGGMVDGVYTQVPNSYLNVKCAGLPDELKEMCDFSNFSQGLQLFGKLKPKHVSGGIVLVPTTFTLL